MVCFYEHAADRLTVLDVGGITARTSHNNDIQNLLHILFKLPVNQLFICHREVTQMNTLRSGLVNAAHQILINILGHERNHRSCALGNRNKCGIKCHVSIDLILLHALCPETLTASSDIPVTHIIHKALQCSCSFGNLVMIQILIHFDNHGIQLA